MSEIDISFMPKKVLKAQLFTNFILEMTPSVPKQTQTWVVFTNKSSNRRGSGAKIIFVNEAEIKNY